MTALAYKGAIIVTIVRKLHYKYNHTIQYILHIMQNRVCLYCVIVSLYNFSAAVLFAKKRFFFCQ